MVGFALEDVHNPWPAMLEAIPFEMWNNVNMSATAASVWGAATEYKVSGGHD